MIVGNRMLASRVRFLVSLTAVALVPAACTDERIVGPAPGDMAPRASVLASATACIAAPANVIGWWRGEGDATDVTGQHHGVIRGGVTFPAGMVGNTASFDGSSAYLEVADAPALDFISAMTIEAWINPTDVVSLLVPIIAKWDDNNGDLRTYFLTLQNGRLRFSISENGFYDTGNSDLFSPTTLQAGIWQHVAATYDGTHMRLYLNGQLAIERATAIRSLFANDRPLLIGAGRIGGSPIRYFRGGIDEPAVYNRALTASEISGIYNAGSFGKCHNRPPVANAGGPYAGNEGAPIALQFSGSDPDGDAITYAWNLGDGTTGSGSTPPATHRYADEGTYTVTLTASDGKGGSDTRSATAVIANVAPAVGPITAPLDPVAVDQPVTVSATFTDAGVLDVHSAVIDWDADGTSTTSAGAVTESGGAGTVSGSHVYTTPGVYAIRITVSDADGGSSSSLRHVVVYDGEAGFVTGGGWIDSPDGAYTADPLVAGRATFGFVARYQNRATRPSGTQFQFRIAGFNFHSETFEWLVISGPKAQLKGSGKVNGAGDYGFIVTVNDGQAADGGGVDRIRIRIWNRTSGDVIYDNQSGSADDANAAAALGGGSIVIHR